MLPKLIFGTLLTSSNYKAGRHGAGRNGYGSKLINIYSHWFIVEVWDDYNELYYYQKWEKEYGTLDMNRKLNHIKENLLLK